MYEERGVDQAALLRAEASAFRRDFPEAEMVDAIFMDLNGVIRGKRLPIAQLERLVSPGIAIPGSAFLLDASGQNHDPCGLGFSDGDPDCLARAIPGTIKPKPWASRAGGQALVTFHEEAGEPYYYEPRNVLARVRDRLGELGLTPVVAFELEFYLIDSVRGEHGAPQPAPIGRGGQRPDAAQLLSIEDLEDATEILAAIEDACAKQGIPTGTVSAEYAPCQFEINLSHVDDSLKAADLCTGLKHAVKGVARAHGIDATFMAKPFADRPGSGMHVHLSLLDAEGHNVFECEKGSSPSLRQAIGGLLRTLPEAMAVFAPNPNSYRRFRPNLFVPVSRSWSRENRSVAVRLPMAVEGAWRFEHRVSGADANPYLVLAAILVGVHHGLSEGLDSGPAFEGNAGAARDEGLPFRLPEALTALAEGEVIPEYFGRRYTSAYVACKTKELEKFEQEIPSSEYRWYLR